MLVILLLIIALPTLISIVVNVAAMLGIAGVTAAVKIKDSK